MFPALIQQFLFVFDQSSMKSFLWPHTSRKKIKTCGFFNSLLKMSNKSHLPQRLKVEQCFNEHFAMIQEQKADVHNELKMWKIVAWKAKKINEVF